MNRATGFYGKVPTHADFIRHNLPRSFIEPWDD
jgi:type VI secretion system protein ImpM